MVFEIGILPLFMEVKMTRDNPICVRVCSVRTLLCFWLTISIIVATGDTITLFTVEELRRRPETANNKAPKLLF